MLECQGLNYFFKTIQRLKNIGFIAKQKELIGLFGHNGAGKTTLLKMLGGSLPIASGNFRLFGRSAIDKEGFLKSDLRKDCATLFQGTSSDDKLSAYYNLRYTAKLMGVASSSIERVVDETLILSDLKDRAHEPVKKLSGGMRRRLEIYRSFMHDPKIVLLDEPTAGLDVVESAKFFSFLSAYQERTMAIVIMSTHRPDEVRRCHRVIMMKDGEIIDEQVPDNLTSGLNYFCCSFSVSDVNDAYGIPVFDVRYDRIKGLMHAKILSSNLEVLLKSSLLDEQKIQGFSIEKPTIADVYEGLSRKAVAL